VGITHHMSGLAIITEACIDVKDRACVDVCPVQCIYEYDPATNQLFSEVEHGSGEIENTHTPDPDAIAIFEDSILYVNVDECTSCTACYQPDVCPVGAIYSEERVPDGGPRHPYNANDPNKQHDHTFFIEHTRAVFAD
jgi:ferredoxin